MIRKPSRLMQSRCSGPIVLLRHSPPFPSPDWDGRVGSRRIGDEGPHAAMLARMYPSIDHELLDAAGLSFGHKIASLFLTMGAPPRNAMNFHWIHEIRRRARERGCDVHSDGNARQRDLQLRRRRDASGPSAVVADGWRWPGKSGPCRIDRAAHPCETSLPKWRCRCFPRKSGSASHRWRHGVDADRLPDWCGLNPDWARRMRVQERARQYEFDAMFRYKPSTLAARRARLSGSEE